MLPALEISNFAFQIIPKDSLNYSLLKIEDIRVLIYFNESEWCLTWCFIQKNNNNEILEGIW